MSLPEVAALQQAAARVGVELSADRAKKLLAYLDLLQRWNSAYNLTAIHDRGSMREHHLVDCLSVLPPLQRQQPGGGKLLDVGSGGGLPGVLIAAMRDDITVTCIDTVGKKAAFIRQVAGVLQLRNLKVEHRRVESMRNQSFDVITARAFASLPDFVRWTRHLLAEGGQWMAMKGQRPVDELAQLPPDIDVFHVEPLPGLLPAERPGAGLAGCLGRGDEPSGETTFAHERCLVWMRPKLRYAPATA